MISVVRSCGVINIFNIKSSLAPAVSLLLFGGFICQILHSVEQCKRHMVKGKVGSLGDP